MGRRGRGSARSRGSGGSGGGSVGLDGFWRSRLRPRTIGDALVWIVVVVALIWAFVPGVGPDLLGLGNTRGPSGADHLAELPDTDVARALRALPARSDEEIPDYKREAFGQRWADTDHNGCDTRNDILARDLARPVFKVGTNDCVVLSGTLAEPYTGKTIEFTRGAQTSDAVQIDHVVALSDAWKSGAWNWDASRRQDYANDPLNLLAVDGPANQDKEDGSTDRWLPPDDDFHCAYVARQIAVKATWGLTVTEAERAAMADVLEGCPDQPLPTR